MARPREISDERMLAAAGVVISRLGPAFTLADVAGEAKVAAGTLVNRFGSKHGLLVAMTKSAIEALRNEMRAVVEAACGPGAVETAQDADRGQAVMEAARDLATSGTEPDQVAEGAARGPTARDAAHGSAAHDAAHSSAAHEAGRGVVAGDPAGVVVGVFSALDDPDTAANNLAQLAFDLADVELRGLMAEFYSVMEAGLVPLLDRAIAAGELPYAPTARVAARILTALADGTAVHWSARPDGGLCERMRADIETVLHGWGPHDMTADGDKKQETEERER
jgi:AcrR family transcriptional regulator